MNDVNKKGDQKEFPTFNRYNRRMVQRERGYLLYNVKYLSDSYEYLSISVNLFYLKYKKTKAIRQSLFLVILTEMPLLLNEFISSLYYDN